VLLAERDRVWRYGIATAALAAAIAGSPAAGIGWAEPDSEPAAEAAEATSAGVDNAVGAAERPHRGRFGAGPGRGRIDRPWVVRFGATTPVDRADDLDDETDPDDLATPAEEPVVPAPGNDGPAGVPDEPESGVAPAEGGLPAGRAALRRTAPEALPRLDAPLIDAHVIDAPAPTASAATALRSARTVAAAAVRAEVVEAHVVPFEPTAEPAAPQPPQPLSPIAQVLELPGRLVNAVLEALGLTISAHGPTSPINLAPINDLLFGLFREWERLFGLWETPPPLPAVPTMTYDGPTDRPTPTVAQLLNAATAAYVLGGTPGGLVPFTANGFQMARTNLLTGTVARAWVTPEGQIIIAYQGTTGGSNLLFNPLIVIPQIIADLQVLFTGTTPAAFYDALDFAEQVRAEAHRQGYTDDDIFVTGHSLGAWQAQFVAQQAGLAGIGFEAPGMNTVVPGNGSDAMFVNVGSYGSVVPLMSTDLPGLQPFLPPYEPAGGTKPHYGPIVMIGDPAASTPIYNASRLWGQGLIGSLIFLIDFAGNFFQYHLPGVQAHALDVTPDPGVVPFLGRPYGPVHEGWGELTIPQLLKAASDEGRLFQP